MQNPQLNSLFIALLHDPESHSLEYQPERLKNRVTTQIIQVKPHSQVADNFPLERAFHWRLLMLEAISLLIFTVLQNSTPYHIWREDYMLFPMTCKILNPMVTDHISLRQSNSCIYLHLASLKSLSRYFSARNCEDEAITLKAFSVSFKLNPLITSELSYIRV
jgi:hypothetical protein